MYFNGEDIWECWENESREVIVCISFKDELMIEVFNGIYFCRWLRMMDGEDYIEGFCYC